MTKQLTAEQLLAGGTTTFNVVVPAELLKANGSTEEPGDGEVTLRPLLVRDAERIGRAAKEKQVLAGALMVQQALVAPKLTVEQVGDLPAGMLEFLLEKVNAISGLSLDAESLDEAVRAPLTRACFILSREFGWTPAQCSELTIGQTLLYLEMLSRDASAQESAL